MRGRQFAAAVSGLLALLPLGACASSDPGPGVSRPGDAVSMNVCEGVEHCRVVARTDVDGDSRTDQVGFVVESKKRVVVRVAAAGGRTFARNLAVTWYPKGDFFGAAPIDGTPGDELVVGTTMGAHTLWFTTLTVRSGRLVLLSAPGPEDEWMIDGAYSFSAGVTRRVENGRAVVVLKEASRVGRGTRFTGHDRTYVWRNNGWERESAVRTRYRTERAVAKIVGWHVQGLPRLPEF